MTPFTTALLVVVLAQSVALGVLLRHRWPSKAANERRVAQTPTSGLEDAHTHDAEPRRRWEALDVTRLHEVNREEVEKVLAKTRAGGVKSLTPDERAFLDRMSDAQARTAGRGGEGGAPSQLPRPS